MTRPGTDASIQQTNDDAQISKLSAVRAGYFRDSYLHHFVRRGSGKRAPLINRGYFARVSALRALLTRFLAAFEGQSVQILSLGCGYDTTFFQLKAEGLATLRYFELDFPGVTRQKAGIILRTRELANLLGGLPEDAQIQPEEGRLVTQDYCLLPGDLRNTAAAEAELLGAGFRPDAPTFVLVECVLVYMTPEDSAAVVRWLGGLLPTAVCAVYEQIRPDDPFGEQMLLNLEARGCPLAGIRGTPSLAAQEARFTDNGWQRAAALDMNAVYAHHTNPQERRRIERLEIFDELEEWHLIQGHYCISLGINDADGSLNRFGFPTFSSATPLPGVPNAA